MPKNRVIQVNIDRSQVQQAVEAAWTRGFQDGVKHSSALFKKLFKRIQSATSITELQLIMKEMDELGSGVVASGKDSRKSPQAKEGSDVV